MKLRSGRRKTSESPVRKVKLRMRLKKPKENAGARLNRGSVKNDGVVKKNAEFERNQDEDSAPSNSGPSLRSCSRRQLSTMFSSSVYDIEIHGPGSGFNQLLEEVLQHIFRFSTFADVNSARMVNKHWRQAATISLRRSSKMIRVDRNVSECIYKMGDGQFPVNRLELSLFAEPDDPENTKTCSAYFPRICAWVKELTLSVHINKYSGVQDDMAMIPTDCVYKDLTHFNLQLRQRTDLLRESWKRFDFVRSILEKSPNLHEVSVEYKWFRGRLGSEKFAVCPVIENLFHISNSVGTSKLNYINFEYVPLEKIDLGKWSTLNLKLKKLGLNVSCFSKTNELLATFLETQTGTLKQLTLNQSHWDSKTPGTFTFPRLEKLQQLRVTCSYRYAVVNFGGIDYARLFPCLKKLDLKDDKENWRDFLGNDLLQPTSTVEELIFPWDLYNDVNLTPNPMVTTAKVFTGLKKLEIYASRDFTQAVYQNMPNLEILTFSNPPFDTYDDIITGLGLGVCYKFSGVMSREWVEELENAEGRSMARLQNLKTLKLSKDRFNCRLCISRLSLHVFKKMRSLKCLDLFHGSAAAESDTVHKVMTVSLSLKNLNHLGHF